MERFVKHLRLFDIKGSLLEDFVKYPQNNLGSFDLIGKLISFADRHAVRGNCWQYYIAYFIAGNENAFSLACERKQDVSGTLFDFAYEDARNLMDIFNLPPTSLTTA